MEKEMDIEEQIKMTLDKVRPFIQRDGGDVTFDSFIDGIVYVNFSGACDGCMMIGDTLGSGISIILQEEVPGVIDVKLASEKPVQTEEEKNKLTMKLTYFLFSLRYKDYQYRLKWRIHRDDRHLLCYM